MTDSDSIGYSRIFISLWKIYRSVTVKPMGLGFFAPGDLESLTDVDTAAITSEAAEVAVVAGVLTAANRNFEMDQKVKRCGICDQASIMFGVGGYVR